MLMAVTLAGCAGKTLETARASGDGACTVAPVQRVEEEGCRETPAPAQLRHKLYHHLKYHQPFPSSAPGVRSALRTSLELDGAEQAWIAGRLPAGTYASADQLYRSLFPGATLARR
jgi:hypothetical protein